MAEAQVGFRPDCEADPRLALSRRTNQDGAWAVLRGNDTNGSNPARGDAKRKAAVTERRRGFRSIKGLADTLDISIRIYLSVCEFNFCRSTAHFVAKGSGPILTTVKQGRPPPRELR
jgi:hypothetical protein